MTKLDPDNQNNVETPAQRWAKRIITMLLLSALIIAGIAVFYSRQEWREMYMRVMMR
jgi:magnesium-transporting ATPase (P-type)